jgi:hypothetical protein
MPPTQQQLMEQLVQLTDAVKDLAHRQVGHRPGLDGAFADVDADDRVRQRVAFSYQALGALTGRVSSATGREFEVRVVEARREPGTIHFRRLPAGADWVELRTGTKVELLRIRREHEDDGDGDGGVDVAAASEAERRERRERRHRGRVHPEDFDDDEPIGSTVFLRGPRGPLVAFGPRRPVLRGATAQPAGGVPPAPTTVPAGTPGS